MHANGIEVILDVVYNHTAEGNQLDPSLTMRGIDNKSYYYLMEGQERYYNDFTGSGNALEPRHPYILRMVIDSLRYWVEEMKVDGFRFDLATTLARVDGEYNRDGTDHNHSWNCGVEGHTDDPGIQALRLQQQRNLMATLLLSQGMLMLLAGDEFNHGQGGNNNADRQDNAITWLDWTAIDADGRRMQEFTRMLASAPRAHRLPPPPFLPRRADPGHRDQGIHLVARRRPGNERGRLERRLGQGHRLPVER
jgi:pullulanase/glycogen debranching enzyme